MLPFVEKVKSIDNMTDLEFSDKLLHAASPNSKGLQFLDIFDFGEENDKSQ